MMNITKNEIKTCLITYINDLILSSNNFIKSINEKSQLPFLINKANYFIYKCLHEERERNKIEEKKINKSKKIFIIVKAYHERRSEGNKMKMKNMKMKKSC